METKANPAHVSSATNRYLAEVAACFDRYAAVEAGWRRRNRTYSRLLESIHRFLIPEQSSVVEIGCGSGDLLAAVRPARGLGMDLSPEMIALARSRHPELEFAAAAGEEFVTGEEFDYVILSDL